MAETGTFIGKVRSVQKRDLSEIRKLEPPKGDEPEVELMLEKVERTNAALERIHALAEEGDA